MTNVQPLNLLIRAERAVLPDGERAVDVGAGDGRVVAVEPPGSPLGDRAGAVVELDRDEVLLPGLVDSHVHVNDPGRTEWEGFETATKAAALGGVPAGWVACPPRRRRAFLREATTPATRAPLVSQLAPLTPCVSAVS